MLPIDKGAVRGSLLAPLPQFLAPPPSLLPLLYTSDPPFSVLPAPGPGYETALHMWDGRVPLGSLSPLPLNWDVSHSRPCRNPPHPAVAIAPQPHVSQPLP